MSKKESLYEKLKAMKQFLKNNGEIIFVQNDPSAKGGGSESKNDNKKKK